MTRARAGDAKRAFATPNARDDERLDDDDLASEASSSNANTTSSTTSGLEYASMREARGRAREVALAKAVANEDYARAAAIRDAIRESKSSAVAMVTEANDGFYRAFRSGDIEQMKSRWARAAHAQCAHPGSAFASGYDDVIASWELIFATIPKGSSIDVRPSDIRVYANDDGWGFVTCVERVGDSRLAATNVFERDPDGAWRLVLHQAHGVVALGGR